MTLLASEIVERFYMFLWPMLRISALLVTAPLFSLDALTLPIRIMLALVVTVLIYPLVNWPVIDPVTANGVLQIVNQIFIGAMMGLMLQIATGALTLAGQTISSSMGLSMATLIDPNVGNVPVIAQFIVILSTLVFLGFGGHVIMLSMVLDSFTAVPIGQSILGQVAFGKVVAWSSMIFLGGVLISLPVMVSLLFINIGMGVITRAAPSLNIFSVGLPASIAAGFLVLILAMDGIVGRIQWLWMQAFNHARDLVGLVS
ncbi:MAG: flagellar biosynthetic protein FliR [Oxalobacteraceae bacterium]|jgi:flagellar biosynthetic protein FliR|nr:flagellar biosynthetic protein FliR [Oxalobacteraceae bacterium]